MLENKMELLKVNFYKSINFEGNPSLCYPLEVCDFDCICFMACLVRISQVVLEKHKICNYR